VTNLPSDQDQVMNLLNLIPLDRGGTLMPEGPATFEVPRAGICQPFLHQSILRFQRSNPGLAGDGCVDPGGATWRTLESLSRGKSGPAGSGGTNPAPPTPPPGPIAPAVARPAKMRESAWRYLLQFTKKHEGAVFNFYNNKLNEKAAQDVTCGVGFRIDPRGIATKAWVKTMFYVPGSNAAPTDTEMLADWDAAAALIRTGSNLLEYGNVCKLRMYPDKVYNQMALILRDQKLPALLGSSADFNSFENFPAAAQTFCLSFAYGRIPFDFPLMRASIRDGRWADAAKQCHQRGCSELKNQAHAQLLLFAQGVVDKSLDFDAMPALIL